MSLLKKIYNRSPIPLQNLAVTFEGMRIQNQRYNKNFKKTLLDYLKNDNLPINKIKEIRLLKLKKLLIFANTYSLFYKDLFSQKKFNPENLKSEEEIEILPIIGKNEIKAFYKDIITINATKEPKTYTHTSGTTGSGLIFPITQEFSNNQWGVWWRHRLRNGITQGKWCAYFGGRPIVPIDQENPPFYRTNLIGKQIIFSAYHLNAKNLESYILKLITSEVEWIHGYPSVITLLAEYILSNNIISKLNIKKISLGAENLSLFQKRIIQEAFGIEPIQHYGLAEGVANISLLENRKFRVDEDFSYVEFVNKNTNQYQIVGTSLSNFAFPLIRYSTGDLARLNEKDKNGWRCVEDIDGREEDYIILKDHSKVGRLDHIFKDVINIKECQFVQNIVGKVDLMVVRAKGYSQKDEKKIIGYVNSYLGNKIILNIKYTEKIPRTSNGKLRFVVSNLIKKN
jgi:phenylacetate-CoA ligase